MADNKQVELHPCPFCGGAAKLSRRVLERRINWLILCAGVDCRAWVGPFEDAGDAVKAWNARAMYLIHGGK